jgi:hypothetical protein
MSKAPETAATTYAESQGQTKTNLSSKHPVSEFF